MVVSRKPRDLTGPEKLKLFRNVDKVQKVIRGCGHRSESEMIQIISVWREFYGIYNLLTLFKTFGSSDADGIE